MDLGHVLFSLQLLTLLLSHLWFLTQMSHAEALELKYKIYQCAPQVSFYKACLRALFKIEDRYNLPGSFL